LRNDEHALAERIVQVLGDRRMASPVAPADRAHLDDDPVEQFDPLVVEQSDVGDAAVVGDGELVQRYVSHIIHATVPRYRGRFVNGR
jgi:hypothetical protein